MQRNEKLEYKSGKKKACGERRNSNMNTASLSTCGETTRS